MIIVGVPKKDQQIAHCCLCGDLKGVEQFGLVETGWILCHQIRCSGFLACPYYGTSESQVSSTF